MSSCTNGPMRRSSCSASLRVGSYVESYLSSIPSINWPMSSFGVSKSRYPNWRTILGNGLCLIEWLIRMVIYFVFSGHTLRPPGADTLLEIHLNSTTRMSAIRTSNLRYRPRDVNLAGAIRGSWKNGEHYIFSIPVPMIVFTLL